MKITMESGYFGDADAMLRFVEGLLKEIKDIDDEGREHSTQPERYLSDCYPSLDSLRIILEKFLARVESETESIEFSTGGN